MAQTYTPQRRVASLDGLKGLSGCVILIFHYSNFIEYIDVYPLNWILHPFYQYGYLCVELFFIISGFIIVRKYEDHISSGEISFSVFFGKRFANLYPLFLLTNMTTFILEFFSKVLTGRYLWSNPIDATLVLSVIPLNFPGGLSPMNRPSWFVSAILLMYAIFYVINKFVKTRSGKIGAWLCMIALGTILGTLDADFIRNNLFLFGGDFYRGMISFSIGILLQYLYSCKFVTYIVWPCIAAYFAGVITFGSDFLDAPHRQGVWIYFILPFVLYIVVYFPPICAVLSGKAVQFLGKISYSLFLVHYPLNVLFVILKRKWIDINFSSIGFFIFYLVFTIIVAICVYYFVEAPIKKKIPNSTFFSQNNMISKDYFHDFQKETLMDSPT